MSEFRVGIALVTVFFAVGNACVHDNQFFSKFVRGHQHYSSDRRIGLTAPIRIKFNTKFIEVTTVPLDVQNYIKTLLTYVQSRLLSVLAVQPVVGNLFVPRNCSLYWTQGANKGQCAEASTVNQCGEVQQIPAEDLGDLAVFLTNGSKYNVSSGTGVSNADLLIYVTYLATRVCDNSTLAYAIPCQIDQNDRPIVGSINFCPSKATPFNDPADLAYHKETALHELIHVLGFNFLLFSFYRDESGSPRTLRCPSAPGCTPNDADGDPPFNLSTGAYALSPSTVLVTTRRGARVSYVVTPAARSVARGYFGCQTAPGAELENSGNAEGTAGSHWEKRILFNELMTGSISEGIPEVLSEFTLALLADSGWYAVNYSAADPAPLRFGRALGCGFLDADCAAAAPAFPYCLPAAQPASPSAAGCTFDRAAAGQCLRDPLMDGCAIYYPYANGGCDNASGRATLLADCGGRDCRGGQYGPGTACFASSAMAAGYAGGARGTEKDAPPLPCFRPVPFSACLPVCLSECFLGRNVCVFQTQRFVYANENNWSELSLPLSLPLSLSPSLSLSLSLSPSLPLSLPPFDVCLRERLIDRQIGR